MLGLERTRSITLTAATAAYSKVALRTAELKRCWQHTVATAVLAEEISHLCGVFSDSAYAAGLMHDIGRLGLLVAYPAEYEKTIRDAAASCLDILDFERERFGVDHAEAGRLLAERWRLPEEFLIVAGRHHDPCEGSEVTLLKIVHVACKLADFFRYDVTRPLKPMHFDEIIADLPPVARRAMTSNADKLFNKVHATLNGYEQVAEPEDVRLRLAELSVVEPIPSEEALEGEEPPAETKPAKVAETPEDTFLESLAAFWHWLARMLGFQPIEDAPPTAESPEGQQTASQQAGAPEAGQEPNPETPRLTGNRHE
jgi:HD superfamily phosphohydrolase YqeK